MSILTIEDAKTQLNIPAGDTSADDALGGYLDGITAAVEDYKHEIIEPRQVTERVNFDRGARRFRLWRAPVIDLVSITSLDGATSWPTDGMFPDPDSGLVDIVSGTAPSGPARVTYRAGYDLIPDNYIRGALVILQHTWETQRGAGSIGAGVIGAEETHARAGSTFTIPAKAKEWLGPPRPVVG